MAKTKPDQGGISAKSYHKNPRKISDNQLSQLAGWLSELGDLSGVVHDLNSNEIIGGNQRSSIFDLAKCKIEFLEKLRKPDKQGTIAHGWIIWEGNKYIYRQVKWTRKQCEKANIVANKAGGKFDFDILSTQFSAEDLLKWGFEKDEIKRIGFENNDPLDFSNEIVPEQYAIMIECDGEKEQSNLLKKFIKDGLKCRALIS